MKCYIYRIQNNNDPEQFYIGSTLNLSRRKSHHKKNVKNRVGKLYWTKLYQYIREHGGWDNFTFTKIGWLYHFCAVNGGPTVVNQWMEKTYKYLYEN